MTGLSEKQLQQLRRKLNSQAIRTRNHNGREISYLEGWYVVSEANRIFGFDRWNRETLETRCIFGRDVQGTFVAAYIAKVRITILGGERSIIREAHGAGEGRGSSIGEAHEIALKASETDATKRALATFGRPFGLALYAGSQAAKQAKVAHREPDRPATIVDPPSLTSPDQPSVFAGTSSPNGKADGDEGGVPTAFLLPKTKRIRDRTHLRFIATQPCLVCGRQPADAHHLKFAQPRALGAKVSDEFTVPLCRGHHRELHQRGDERVWWRERNIDALAIAIKLRKQSPTLGADQASHSSLVTEAGSGTDN